MNPRFRLFAARADHVLETAMSRRQNSPRFSRPVVVLAWLASLALSTLPLGAVVLTNGRKIHDGDPAEAAAAAGSAA